MAKKYWLMKSEPDVFSFEDLKNMPRGWEHWDGVRNYQARNFMRDDMRVGDQILFYHSNCKPPGVIGIAEVCKEAYPDHTSWDSKSKYYDPKSNEENPRWFMVDVKWKKDFKRLVSLEEIKNTNDLEDMRLVQKGSRLSVMPVEKNHFDFIKKLGSKK